MLSLLFMLMSINSCQALEEYSLQIKVAVHPKGILAPFLAFQSVSPVVVSVELSNMGNNTFNGTLTIKGKTEDGSYTPMEYPISNLTKDVVHSYSASFRTDDAGTYWFTIEIESNKTLSNIKLYEDSILKDEGYQVEVKDSIFYHSFSEFIAIVGIIVGAIVTLVAVYLRRRGSAEKL